MPREEPNPEFSSRLTDLVGEEKNRAALARALGVHRSTIDPYLDKGRVPKWRQLLRIAERYCVTSDWLLTGREPKRRGEWAPRELSAEELRENWREVPLVADEIAAGAPMVIRDEDVEEKLLVPRAWLKPSGRYACVRVRGRSMHPVLSPGDIVGVNLRQQPVEQLWGKIVAARTEGGVTIKYLRHDEENYILVPANREYTPIVRPLTEEGLVIGPVEWAWRRFD